MRVFLFIVFLFVPVPVMAANSAQPENQSQSVDLSRLNVTVIDLGQDLRRGVVARVQLQPQAALDLSEPAEKNLYHYKVIVSFTDKKTGENLLKGQAAARIFADKYATSTVRLEPQTAEWTGFVLLPTEEEVMIKIGSKLADGKKRIYRFFFQADEGRFLLEPAQSLQ